MAYGSGVRRQGRSRAFSANQESKSGPSALHLRVVVEPKSSRRSTFFLVTVAEHKATAYDDTHFVKPLTSFTCKLDDKQAAALKAYLQEHDYKFREVPYARFAGEREKLNVVFYESGKLVVQGK